jgi:aspartate/methionine/tyrosine aminotransferase
MNQQYDAAVSIEQTAIVAGCNQGFCAVVSALVKSGDEVILPLPYYFNHQMWVEMTGGRAIPLPFNENIGAVPSVKDAAAAITERTRAIALVTPNNPTGAIYPAEIIDGFYQLARSHGIALIIDETYKDFRDSTAPAHQLFSYDDWQDVLIQLYSFSKTFSLTGYRVGSVIANERLLFEIGKFQDCVAICAPRIGQEAALFGLQHLQSWCEDKRRLMIHRAQALQTAFEHHQLRYQLVSLGAYFAYVKHPFTGESATSVAKRLVDEHHVLCLPGSTFGPGQDQYLRLAFANLDAEQMPELAQRLSASEANS